jgi:hypothetical protein
MNGRVLLLQCVEGSTIQAATALAIADVLSGSDQRIDLLLLEGVFRHLYALNCAAP